jgi:putative SOS response-associated peptidase YedK
VERNENRSLGLTEKIQTPFLRPTGAPIETFTIITGEANSLTAELHNRMTVILDPADYASWLTAADTAIPQAMLQPFPAQLMTAYPAPR